jgi:hypothetical protein
MFDRLTTLKFGASSFKINIKTIFCCTDLLFSYMSSCGAVLLRCGVKVRRGAKCELIAQFSFEGSLDFNSKSIISSFGSVKHEVSITEHAKLG